MLKVFDEIDLTIDKFADKGKCLSRFNGFVIFIEGVIPSEKVRVRIERVKKNYAEAKLLSILKESPLRVKPKCIHFGYCGGCKWQHVFYNEQLKIKTQTVSDALLNIANLKEIKVEDTIPSSDIYYYRTKMEFSFSNRCWTPDKDTIISHNDNFALGLHAPSQFSTVLDIKECHLQRPPSTDILNAIRTFVKEKKWLPWNNLKKQGFLKHLIIRVGIKTSDVMVNIVTDSFEQSRMKILGDFLKAHFPQITTFVNTILPGTLQNVTDGIYEIIFGPGYIKEKIGNFKFHITPTSFFQSNTLQAEILYNLAKEYAQLKEKDTVLDLYCGIGTISIFISPQVKKVIGIDSSKEAIDCAIENAKINLINNCNFIVGDVTKVLTANITEYKKPDIVIVDPPRPGLHKKIIQKLLSLSPRCIIYISCNPHTQMRDIAMLSNQYKLEKIQAIDMFPQTYHVESIAKLTLIN
ncbi:MAG: 23S rRNA (uracil(1939)-C(5))-methyltransferase RlmD [Thermodesulfovibrionales bacterium]|nr:23S rRNA (uracil(1939)-C(5))-methyltransferase RlmD [Thermodesulfovibrionales bacterium]